MHQFSFCLELLKGVFRTTVPISFRTVHTTMSESNLPSQRREDSRKGHGEKKQRNRNRDMGSIQREQASEYAQEIAKRDSTWILTK